MTDAQRGILIIEDDPEIAFLLSAILDAPDRAVTTAADGALARAALQRGGVDLVVLDLILPDVDGRTLLSEIRQSPETANVPVVVISARGGKEIREDCYSLGADFFTEKPFDPDEVAADISARLERAARRSRDGLSDPVTGLANRAALVAEVSRDPRSRAVALLQLDGFLSVSDRWGWEFGEEVLSGVARALASRVSEEAGRVEAAERARVAHVGGGEFAVVLETDSGGAIGLAEPAVQGVCEAALEAVRTLPLSDPDGETFRLTACGAFVAREPGRGRGDALGEARRRLCRAGESGHNRVVAHDEDAETGDTRILVAEDDEISATILTHRLRKEGLEITHCANGREAYESALENPPDMVILDVKMPGMDGFEVLERLRRTPALSAIPIVMLTSMGSEADVVRGFQLGADDYVLKPFSPVELSARVWRLLRRGRSATAL